MIDPFLTSVSFSEVIYRRFRQPRGRLIAAHHFSSGKQVSNKFKARIRATDDSFSLEKGRVMVVVGGVAQPEREQCRPQYETESGMEISRDSRA